MKTAIITLSLVFFVLLSCNSAKKSTKNQQKPEVLEIMEYTIVKIEGLDELLKNPTIKLDFKTNKISGNNSCNQYGGEFTHKGDTINFGRLMATKMYCAKFQKIESTYMKTLSRVRRFKIKENQILFYDKADTVLLVGEK